MDKPSDLVPLPPKELPLSGGRLLVLEEPNMLDIADAQEILGDDLQSWFEEANVIKTLPVLMWVCSRGHGLSQDEKINRAWKQDYKAFQLATKPRDVTTNANELVLFFVDAFGLRVTAEDLEGSSSEESNSDSHTGT